METVPPEPPSRWTSPSTAASVALRMRPSLQRNPSALTRANPHSGPRTPGWRCPLASRPTYGQADPFRESIVCALSESRMSVEADEIGWRHERLPWDARERLPRLRVAPNLTRHPYPYHQGDLRRLGGERDTAQFGELPGPELGVVAQVRPFVDDQHARSPPVRGLVIREIALERGVAAEILDRLRVDPRGGRRRHPERYQAEKACVHGERLLRSPSAMAPHMRNIFARPKHSGE